MDEEEEEEQVTTPADFREALFDLNHGKKVWRTGWNAEGQYVVLQKGYPDGIGMLRTADGSFVPWQPTVTDVLAEDWVTTVAR
jgi:hypothetical protein